MEFAACTFTVSTKLGEGSPVHQTTVSLTASTIDDKIVSDALISGQSPRVRYQTNLRNSGKIPATDNMTWSEWISPTRKVVKVAREMSAEEIQIAALKGAQSDPDARKKLLAELLAMENNT